MRLFRPHIPLEVRCRVAMRQLGEMWPNEVLKAHEGGLRALLDQLLKKLSELLEDQLHLDHDPPLAARQCVPLRGRVPNGHKWFNDFGVAMRYEPDANDPRFLIYRGKRAHHIKTNVRGDGAQYPDRVLIRRERKRREGKRKKLKRKWLSRPFSRRRT